MSTDFVIGTFHALALKVMGGMIAQADSIDRTHAETLK